jgi:hypothetical protein
MVGGEDSRTPFYQGTGNDLGGEESICGLSFSRRLAPMKKLRGTI